VIRAFDIENSGYRMKSLQHIAKPRMGDIMVL